MSSAMQRCVMFYCVFVTFPCGVLGHEWYLIVSISDLCLLTCFEYDAFSNTLWVASCLGSYTVTPHLLAVHIPSGGVLVGSLQKIIVFQLKLSELHYSTCICLVDSIHTGKEASANVMTTQFCMINKNAFVCTRCVSNDTWIISFFKPDT